jgi:catecholate siderophore receptor
MLIAAFIAVVLSSPPGHRPFGHAEPQEKSQPSDTIPPDSSRKRKADAVPHQLGSITVSETARPAHRYTASWSSTATKTSTPLRDTPQSVSIVTKSVIREQSMLSMADALRYVPGVTMGQGEGHRDAPTIRGNSSTSDFFIDGVRDDAQYFRDLYNVERIEALGGANAMVFGRGGGGGVINRVTRKANWDEAARELTLEGGSYGHGRGTLDVGGAFSESLALRLTGVYQHSGGFRDFMTLSRTGLNPTAALRLAERTYARVGAEYFEDRRTVDRGLPSFQGRPSSAPLDVFFGNPDSSRAQAKVHSADATIEHRAGERASLRTHARVMVYDKFYQNVLPGAVDASGSNVSLSAYNAGMDRTNVFSQTELALRFSPVAVTHTLLLGTELGRQTTDNVRRTGYFEGTSTSISVPFDAPTVTTPVEFRPSTSDADNHVVVNVASVYAQDQIHLSPKWQATLGVRVERFDLTHRDKRSSQTLERTDDVVSPRLGLVFKPLTPFSLYSSFSRSHLPSSGDQFSGLTATTKTLEPERFSNYEVGAKWDVRPELSVAAAAYRLMRTNAAAPSALDPGIIVQTGEQKTSGYELSFNGRVTRQWDIAGALTSQRSKIASTTTAAPAGATVPLVPRHILSLWNRYQPLRTLGLGLGAVHQSAMYAAIDNAVTLPGFWRVDAAAFLTGFQNVTMQVNLENLLDRRYYATSHGNNNIMPGAPRTLRVSLTTQIR